MVNMRGNDMLTFKWHDNAKLLANIRSSVHISFVMHCCFLVRDNRSSGASKIHDKICKSILWRQQTQSSMIVFLTWFSF